MILFIELAMHVIRCYGSWCTEVPFSQLSPLMKAGLVEVVFEIPLIIKIYLYRLKERKLEDDSHFSGDSK